MPVEMIDVFISGEWMKNRLMLFRHAGFLLVLLFLCGTTKAQHYKSLSMDGRDISNACLPENLDELHKVFLRADFQSADQVWKAMTTVLCAPLNAETRAYVSRLIPKQVKDTVEYTAQGPVKELISGKGLAGKLMAQGEAWSADMNSEKDKVKLLYFANEACVKSVTFVYVNKRWQVDEVGEACD